MKTTAILFVVGIKEGVDKNGKEYRNISVETASIALVKTADGERAIKVKPRRSSFNAWKESYLESAKGAADYGYDLALGDALAGTIVTRKVLTAMFDAKDSSVIVGYAKSYTIENEGRPATTTDEYSAVVLADTADIEGFEAEVRKTFRRAGHPLLDDSSIAKVAILADPVVVGETVGV